MNKNVRGVNMKKLVILGSIILITSFATTASAEELRTYYNQNVPYKAFFQKHNPQQIKIQKTVNGKVVQAVVPANIVNKKEDDKTQETKKEE
jgi:hypothetical protein